MILVIFDIDGTLVHSNKVDSQCFSETYQTVFGQPFPTIDWSTYPHVTDDTIFATVFKNHFGRLATPAEKQHFQEKFVARIESERRIRPEAFNEVPGAKKMIERLVADDRFVVGIGTGGWHLPAMTKLNYVNIPIANLHISCADGHPTREDIVRTAIRKAKTEHPDFSKIVYIGDARWDLETCQNMNIPLIGIRVKGDLDFFDKDEVEYVFENYEDGEGFVRGLLAVCL